MDEEARKRAFENFTPRANPPVASQREQPAGAPLKTPLGKRTAVEMRDAASERLDLAIAAVEAILRDSEARHSDKLAAATFIRDTAHGKPSQSMEITQKIGIVQIVMEMNKQAKLQPAGDNLMIGAVDKAQVIDNE